MQTDRMPVVDEPCPCGTGRIKIDIIVVDNGWETKEEDTVERILCRKCAAQYSLLSDGRGFELVRKEEAKELERLQAEAEKKERAFLKSPEVKQMFRVVAYAFDSLPTTIAKYRLACTLRIESATLATFRKHLRRVPIRRSLKWRFSGDDTFQSLRNLLPLYRHFRVPSANLRATLAMTRSLRIQASEQPESIMTFGPVDLLAAFTYNKRKRQQDCRSVIQYL